MTFQLYSSSSLANEGDVLEGLKDIFLNPSVDVAPGLSEGLQSDLEALGTKAATLSLSFFLLLFLSIFLWILSLCCIQTGFLSYSMHISQSGPSHFLCLSSSSA